MSQVIVDSSAIETKSFDIDSFTNENPNKFKDVV